MSSLVAWSSTARSLNHSTGRSSPDPRMNYGNLIDNPRTASCDTDEAHERVR
ncbi:hypothetical protein M413DRAFT_445658 [Hebeloma cylindrosporum]|uniref:Uncharacterized protein n=1 Tax=Hebeloma cylindrosporum TaxID=76867 RepID=A0A0C2YII5_HEBCY|nr:hypothetical protein M413DRAFT_445658 [Hebeloma cylindrosporum h7]